jgi:hypothetical protein
MLAVLTVILFAFILAAAVLAASAYFAFRAGS